MAAITYHPDTSLGTREALEVRVGDGVIYTLLPGIPTDVAQEHLSAVQTAIARSAATQALSTPAQPAVLTGTGASGGAVTYTYTVVASNDQGDSQQSTARSTATGQAVLSAGTPINIPLAAPQVGQVNWKVIRTAGNGGTGLIATLPASAAQAVDQAQAATAYSSATLAGTATANTGTGGGVGITDSGQAWSTTGQGMKGTTVTMGGKTLVVISNDATHLNGTSWYSAGAPTTPPGAGAYTIAPNEFSSTIGSPAEL